jgi:transcriptional regulator with XRE-family HTH domain
MAHTNVSNTVCAKPTTVNTSWEEQAIAWAATQAISVATKPVRDPFFTKLGWWLQERQMRICDLMNRLKELGYDLDRRCISHWRDGRSPTLRSIEKIAAALGIETRELLFELLKIQAEILSQLATDLKNIESYRLSPIAITDIKYHLSIIKERSTCLIHLVPHDLPNIRHLGTTLQNYITDYPLPAYRNGHEPGTNERQGRNLQASTRESTLKTDSDADMPARSQANG